MVTRRTLLKQGAYATVAAATASILTRRVSAASAPDSFDFYISPTGSDSNPGTHDRPWAITAINTHQHDYAGKKVGLLDGTYNVHSLFQAQGTGGFSVALNANGGTASSPTLIAAVNPRRAILTAADPSTGAYPTLGGGLIGQGYQHVPNPGNVILDGLYVTRSFGPAIYFTPQTAAPTTAGIVVRNCEVFDISGLNAYNLGGIKLRFCSGALVHNNQIHSVQPQPNHGAAGIQTFNCHSNIYEYNTIYDCNTGIYDKNPQNGNQTVRFNYIECAGVYPEDAMTDCSGGNAGDVITVHNNIFIAPGTWDGSDMVMPSKQSLVFYNNTCYHTQRRGIFYPAGGSSISPPATVQFYNNIVYLQQPAGYAGAVKILAGTVTLSNYNVFRVVASSQPLIGVSPVSSPRSGVKVMTLSQWQKSTGLDPNSLESTAASAAMFSATSRLNPNGYALQGSSVGRNLGRIGGLASGAVTDAGAWGGGATQIGCDFGPSPQAPVLHAS
jgi:hypothetical protein